MSVIWLVSIFPLAPNIGFLDAVGTQHTTDKWTIALSEIIFQ